MKESVSSLRWFFALGGLLVFAGHLLLIFRGLWLDLFSTPLSTIETIVSFFLTLATFYFAITLPKYLHSEKVGVVKKFLLLNFGVDAFFSLVDFMITKTIDLASFAVMCLIFWYLYRQVSKLSATEPVVQ
jgi:hypothetical protein